jgi:hypothetical protein
MLLAVVFSLLCLTGLWGLLIIPAEIGPWLAAGSLVASALLWAWSQWLLAQRMKVACAPEIQDELHQLCLRADELIDGSELQAAYRTLLIARSLNDEDVEVNVRWARLLTLMGRFRHARRAWNLVIRLSRSRETYRQAVEALEKLPR